MLVDDEGVPVAQGRMAVRVAVRLGALPAFMLVLMVRVVDMQMLMPHRLVAMLQVPGVGRWPEQGCQRRSAGRDERQDEEGGGQSLSLIHI